jgi:hypothetical protein
MSRCRKLAELVFVERRASTQISVNTNVSASQFRTDFFAAIFKPLNSIPVESSSSNSAAQKPFPSLLHLSVFLHAPFGFLRLFELVSRLIPLRGLRSLTYEMDQRPTVVRPPSFWIIFLLINILILEPTRTRVPGQTVCRQSRP